MLIIVRCQEQLPLAKQSCYLGIWTRSKSLIISLFLQVYINSINLLLNLILPTLVLGILNYRIYKALSPGIEKVHFCLTLQLNFVQFYFVFGYSGN